jgi:signal transduction histidine kinase
MRALARDTREATPSSVASAEGGTSKTEPSAAADRNVPWLVYVSIVSVAGVAVVPWLLVSTALGEAFRSGGFWLFSAFVFLGELFPLRVQMRDELIENTTSIAFSFALILAYGAGAAVLPNIVASAVGDMSQRKSLLRILFNIGQYTLSIAAAGGVYALLDGHSRVTAHEIPAVLAAAATIFLVNTVVTSVAVGLSQRTALLPYVWRNVVFSLHMTPALLALSPIVLIVADESLWFVPLFGIPIAAVYWGMNKALENSRLVEQLRQSLDQMTELNRMKDDFVAVVSHELRTPLTSIQGYVKSLLQLSDRLDTEQQRSFLEAADRQSDRLRGLIEQLLVVARLETHGEPLAVGRVSLASVSANVVEELRPRANGHTFDLRFDPRAPIVRTDEAKVHQILSNLVENALKYSPSDTRITIAIEPGVDGIVAVVSDEGRGIPEEHREHVFERFYQVDSSPTRSVGGTGLGLYICRKTAEQIGGRIWLESSSRGGSSFRLFVPSRPPEADAERGDASVGSQHADQSIIASA